MVAPLVAAGYRAVRPDTRGLRRVHDRGRRVLARGRRRRRARCAGDRPGGAGRQLARRDDRVRHRHRVPGAGRGRRRRRLRGWAGSMAAGRPRRWRSTRSTRRSTAADPFDADALTEFEAGVWLDGPGQPAGRVDAALRAAFIEMARPLNEPGRVRGQRIALDPPANDRLAELRCPVLAIAGALDFSEVTAPPNASQAARTERTGTGLARRRAHDRDGAAGSSRGGDRRVPRAARPLGVNVAGNVMRLAFTSAWLTCSGCG